MISISKPNQPLATAPLCINAELGEGLGAISTAREPHLLIWSFLTWLPVIKEAVKTDSPAQAEMGGILVAFQGKRKESTQ